MNVAHIRRYIYIDRFISFAFYGWHKLAGGYEIRVNCATSKDRIETISIGMKRAVSAVCLDRRDRKTPTRW